MSNGGRQVGETRVGAFIIMMGALGKWFESRHVRRVDARLVEQVQETQKRNA